MAFRRRDVLVMVVAGVLYEKSVFLKYFNGQTAKDVCLINVFVVIRKAGVVSLPPEVWKSFVRP